MTQKINKISDEKLEIVTEHKVIYLKAQLEANLAEIKLLLKNFE